MDLNIVAFTCTLAREPYCDTTPSGQPMCVLSLTVTEHAQSRLFFLYVQAVAYGTTAERCASLAVGTRLLVEGKLMWRPAPKPTPEKKGSLAVYARQITVLDDVLAHQEGQEVSV